MGSGFEIVGPDDYLEGIDTGRKTGHVHVE